MKRFNSASSKIRLLVALLVLVIGLSLYGFGDVQPVGLPRTFLQEAGTLLAVATLVDLLYAFLLRAEHDQTMLELTEQSLRKWLDGLVPRADELGLTGIVGQMPFESLFTDLDKGDELLFFDTFSPQQSAYEDALKAAVRRGAFIRMLIIKPDAITAALRGAEVDDRNYREPARFRAQIENGLHRIEGYAKSLVSDPSVKGKLEVRLYSTLPCMPMYLKARRNGKRGAAPVAQIGYTGFFLSHPSFSGVHLEWRSTPGSMLARFVEYFERKWSEAEKGVWINVPVESKVPIKKLDQLQDACIMAAAPVTTRLIPGGVGGVYPNLLTLVHDYAETQNQDGPEFQLDVLGLTLFTAWPLLILPLLGDPRFHHWRIRLMCLEPRYLKAERAFPSSWTNQARAQLVSICGYLSEHEPELAARHLKIDLRTYKTFPAMHGFRVERERIVAWLDWDDDKVHVKEPYQPYEVLEPRDTDAQVMRMDLFDRWWDRALHGGTRAWPVEDQPGDSRRTPRPLTAAARAGNGRGAADGLKDTSEVGATAKMGAADQDLYARKRAPKARAVPTQEQ